MSNTDGEDTHTLGPWKVKTAKEPLRPTTYEIRNHEGLLIASVNIGMFDVERNANLIASAPDMLKELASIREQLAKKEDEILEWKVRFSDRSLELEDDNKKLTKINNDLVEWMKLMLCRTMPSNVREDIEQIIRQYNNIEISRLSAKLGKV